MKDDWPREAGAAPANATSPTAADDDGPEGQGPLPGLNRRDAVRMFLRAPILAMSSQAVGMVQLALLLFRVGANEATDVYFYLFSLGMVPITGIIVGVMYPSLLNEERLSRRDLATIRWVTPVICIGVAAIGAGWLHANDRLGREAIAIAVLCMANSAVQARLWYRAVAAEAGGNAVWTAGIALAPNILAAVALLVPWPSDALAVTAMVAGLVIGNVGLLVAMAARGVGDAVLQQAPTTSSRRGSLWFLSMASIEFVGQTVLQSLAVLLPASSVTLLNVAYKIVASVAATFVNATMPLLVHAGTESPRQARRFLRFVVSVTMIVGACAVAAGYPLLEQAQVLPAVVVACWLVTSSATALTHRMSFRFLTPMATLRPMIVVIVVVGLAALSARGAGFDLTTLLCAYAAMDGACATLLLWPLKDRVMSIVLAALLVGIAAVWLIVSIGPAGAF